MVVYVATYITTDVGSTEIKAFSTYEQAVQQVQSWFMDSFTSLVEEFQLIAEEEGVACSCGNNCSCSSDMNKWLAGLEIDSWESDDGKIKYFYIYDTFYHQEFEVNRIEVQE